MFAVSHFAGNVCLILPNQNANELSCFGAWCLALALGVGL